MLNSIYIPFFILCKNMDIADSVIRNYRLEGTHFPVPMLISQCKFVCLVRPTFGQVRTSPLDYPIIDDHCVNVVKTGRWNDSMHLKDASHATSAADEMDDVSLA